MPRPRDPTVRTALLERAAQMLRRRQPITLRSLIEGSGVSTMAVYTHFGGMDGLWRALRQEGFTRLEQRMAAAPSSDDPVEDLAALIAAYTDNARHQPDLYRVMFDADFELEDAEAADATLEHLVQGAVRAQRAGRFDPDLVPLEVATRTWAAAHGVVSLVATGPLPVAAIHHCPVLLTALFVACGDDRDSCRRSVERGWARLGDVR